MALGKRPDHAPGSPIHRFHADAAYVPPGVLRASITYPRSADASDDAVIAKALADVGLERLEPLLDKADRWDHLLSDDEKQCLAFARVILQRPRWVVIDDALDVFDPGSRRRIEAIFVGQLADVGVINIGNDENESGFFTRRLQLVNDPNGLTFKPADVAAAPGQIQPPQQTFAGP